MNPWLAKAVILASTIAMIAIRAPYGRRSRSVPIASDRKGRLEIVLLTFVMTGFLVPLVWIATPLLSFADYPLHPVALVTGAAGLAAGLWLFWRSHKDLGRNWSITLQVREGHQLITQGVYRRIRHPMYTSLLLYSIGQALALPNWIAGPSYLAPFVLLLALRYRAEERMMLDRFGGEYAAYAARTKRLVPGIW